MKDTTNLLENMLSKLIDQISNQAFQFRERKKKEKKGKEDRFLKKQLLRRSKHERGVDVATKHPALFEAN